MKKIFFLINKIGSFIDFALIGKITLGGFLVSFLLFTSCSSEGKMPATAKRKNYGVQSSSGEIFFPPSKKAKSRAPQSGFYKQKSYQGFASKLYVSLAGVFGDDYVRNELGINSGLSQQAYNNKYKNEGLARMKTFLRGRNTTTKRAKRKKDNSSDAFSRPAAGKK